MRRVILALITLPVALLLLSACEQEGNETLESSPTAVSSATPMSLSYVEVEPVTGLTSLRCEECRAVEVVSIDGPATLLTSEGAVRLYGVFIAPEEEECVEAATGRLTELSGMTVRVEVGAQEADANGTPLRYVFTESGDSIDEILLSEGVARISTFNGPHYGWLLRIADRVSQSRTGCIWNSYNELFS